MQRRTKNINIGKLDPPARRNQNNIVRRPLKTSIRRAILVMATLAAAPTMALPRHAPVPGGIAVLKIDAVSTERPQAWFGEAQLAVVEDGGAWYALVGLPLSLPPGPRQIAVEAGGERRQLSFEVVEKQYPTQRLQLRDLSKVTPGPDDEARIERERPIIDALKHHFSDAPMPETDFSLPATGPLSSRFGLRRFFNGQARSPHAGLDLSAPAGAPVLAPAAGTVIGVGDYFFTGNTIFVDHGQGLITIYAHLSRVDVAPGQAVDRGTSLGACGATGRATGPHLHWATVLNGTPVDPQLFLNPRAAAPTRPARSPR